MYKVVYTLSRKVVCWKHSKEALLVVSMRDIWFLEFLEFYLSVLLVGWLVGWLGICWFSFCHCYYWIGSGFCLFGFFYLIYFILFVS